MDLDTEATFDFLLNMPEDALKDLAQTTDELAAAIEKVLVARLRDQLLVYIEEHEEAARTYGYPFLQQLAESTNEEILSVLRTLEDDVAGHRFSMIQGILEMFKATADVPDLTEILQEFHNDE